MPDITQAKPFSHLVVDRNGQPLRAFADSQGVWRYPTQYKQVSANYIEALITYEDRQFWSHHGVNPFALFRAVFQMLINGRTISGGSTLTMQVARIIEPHSKTVPGKLWQMFRAFQLEYYLDKQQILTLYLNYAPFGGPVEGIEAASYTYLNKSALELSDAEAALLAVLPQSPSRFRPDRHAVRAEKARNKVLQRIQDYQVWTRERVRLAKQESVVANFNSRPLLAPLLSRRLVTQHPEKQLIETTIDIDLQRQIADRVKGYLERFSESTSAAALVIENDNLEVVSYVGAGDFGNRKRFGHVDMNQAIRSPGSTLKPFIYGMAIDQGLIHSKSLLQDVPLDFEDYSPKNFTKQFSGPVSVTQALQQSLNIPAVQVLKHLGPAKFAGQLENAGLKLYLPDNRRANLSLALGGVGVKLESLVPLYRALASGGRSGKLNFLQNQPLQESYFLSDSAAWIIGDILSQRPVLDNFSLAGSRGITEKSNQWIAHKTGTSYGHRDAWMVATTQTHTIAVWIGKPDGTPSPGEFGRKTAAPLVDRILNVLPREHRQPMKRPYSVSQQNICWPLGISQHAQAAEHCHQMKSAWLVDQIAPVTLVERAGIKRNPVHVQIDPRTKRRVYPACFDGQVEPSIVALWPSRLELWLDKKWQFSSLMPLLHEDCVNKVDVSKELVIIGLANNSRITASPDRKNALSLGLSVSGGKGRINWLHNGRYIGESENGADFLLDQLAKGQHRLMVFDSYGQRGELNFQVL
jgi:penicillin-binding protein 1C